MFTIKSTGRKVPATDLPMRLCSCFPAPAGEQERSRPGFVNPPTGALAGLDALNSSLGYRQDDAWIDCRENNKIAENPHDTAPGHGGL
jgi:hypothetical protein